MPTATDEASGIRIPGSQLARDAAQLVRDDEGDFLFQHSADVYYWTDLAGKPKGLTFDPELLHVAAIFHDFGLPAGFRKSHLRYKVDGANAAREFCGLTAFRRLIANESGLRSRCTRQMDFPQLFPIAAHIAEGADVDLVGALAQLDPLI